MNQRKIYLQDYFSIGMKISDKPCNINCTKTLTDTLECVLLLSNVQLVILYAENTQEYDQESTLLTYLEGGCIINLYFTITIFLSKIGFLLTSSSFEIALIVTHTQFHTIIFLINIRQERVTQIKTNLIEMAIGQNIQCLKFISNYNIVCFNSPIKWGTRYTNQVISC